MPKISESPSASAADGLKEYAEPWLTDVAGEPAIVGARLPLAAAAASSSSLPPHAANETANDTRTHSRERSRAHRI
jgi:hypothetical protein